MRQLLGLFIFRLFWLSLALGDPEGFAIETDTAEVKVSIEVSNTIDFERSLTQLQFYSQFVTSREVRFLDTPGLDLFHHGTLIRLRESKTPDGESDFTTKFRPFSGVKIDDHWLDVKGFKCEFDVSNNQATESCSLKTKKFNPTQQEFLDQYSPYRFSWSTLKTFGPAKALSWRAEFKEIAGDVDIETWILKEKYFLEISQKTNLQTAYRTLLSLRHLIRKLGLKERQETSGKTEFLLTHGRP